MRKEKIELPIEEIIEQYESGKTTRELGIEYNVSRGTISNRIIEYYKNIGKEAPNHKIKKLPIGKIATEYEKGEKIQHLAQKYNVLCSTMTKKLDEYYMDKGQKRPPTKKGRKKISIPVEDIIRKYESGLSQNQIAEEYHVAQVIIWGRINEYYKQTGKEKPVKKISGRKRIEIPIDEIVKEFENGTTQIELAQKYGVSNLVISNRLKEYYGKLGEKTPKILRSSELIVNYLEKGLTIEKILEVARYKNIIIPQHIIDKALNQTNKKNLNYDTETR